MPPPLEATLELEALLEREFCAEDSTSMSTNNKLPVTGLLAYDSSLTSLTT